MQYTKGFEESDTDFPFTQADSAGKRGRGKKKGVSDALATDEAEVKPEVKEQSWPYARPAALPARPSTIRVVSQWPAIVILDAPSGDRYTWRGAGTIVAVKADDLAFVLSNNRTDSRGCCGGEGDRIKFRLADE